MKDKVKVRIFATEEVQYQQTVEIPRSEFEKIEELFASGDEGAANDIISEWLDRFHVCGSDDFEVHEFCEVKP